MLFLCLMCGYPTSYYLCPEVLIKILEPANSSVPTLGYYGWEEYENRYQEEMLAQQGKIKELAKRATRGVVTLLCFEREENPHCPRHLLRRLIDGSG